MTSTPLKQSIPQIFERYWGLLVLLVWGGVLLGFGVLRTSPYGLDEGAARGLLLIWSISDKIVNPIVTLGIPDFRALLFAPLGAYWPGSIVAAKVLTLLLTFAAVTLLYRWSKRTADGETAMIASILLLVSPQLINDIDAIGAGVYLLLAFAVGDWLNQLYRKSHQAFSGWFFIQLVWVSVTVTLHPAGLAYPLALGWSWHKDPLDPRQKRHLLMGLSLVTVLVLALRGGWSTLHWWINPVLSLSQAHQAVIGIIGPNWVIGILLASVLVLVVWLDRYFLTSDFIGRMLLLGGFLGLASADDAWVIVALTIICYRGTVHLINLNQKLKGENIIRQRGIVLTVAFALTTVSMVADKSHARAIALGTKSPQDQLIQYLAQDLSDAKDVDFKAASQWPGRTMIALRRDVFPLPHGEADGETLLKNIKGINYLIFDHNAIRNRELARNISELGGTAETLYLEKGGVIIQIHDNDTAGDTGKAGTKQAPHAETQAPAKK
jgi:hypothetical protein